MTRVRLFSGYGELNSELLRSMSIADVAQALEDGSLQRCVRDRSPWESDAPRSRTGCRVTVAYAHGFEIGVYFGGRDDDAEAVDALGVNITPLPPPPSPSSGSTTADADHYTDRFLTVLPTREALETAERLMREGRLPLCNDGQNEPSRADPEHVAMLSHAYFDELDRDKAALLEDWRRRHENIVVDTRLLTDSNPFC